MDEMRLNAEPIGEMGPNRLDTERFRCVVARKKNMDSKLSRIKKRVMCPFTGYIGIESRVRGIAYERAPSASYHPDRANPIRAARQRDRRAHV